jgi:hypothetical protein
VTSRRPSARADHLHALCIEAYRRKADAVLRAISEDHATTKRRK